MQGSGRTVQPVRQQHNGHHAGEEGAGLSSFAPAQILLLFTLDTADNLAGHLLTWGTEVQDVSGSRSFALLTNLQHNIPPLASWLFVGGVKTFH